jgi:hypothetical protein
VIAMNHYCTYFDARFLTQGLALWGSLVRHDPDAVLWVLALDGATAKALTGISDPRLRVVSLAELEAGDVELLATKANRTRVEYYFTLSPCWPLWLLRNRDEISAITSLDADLFFFSAPSVWWARIDASGASVCITAHRYPPEFLGLEKWGRYNVGIQYFRRDDIGLAVLADWRAQCLEWCYDRLEAGRFADQKYLDAWPERFGRAVQVFTHLGVNAAPWNWAGTPWRVAPAGLEVGGVPLVVFHFAKFRPLGGGIWDSGQMEFAVMPRWLRVAIYGPYVQALAEAAILVGVLDQATSGQRGVRMGFKKWLLRALFGSLWLQAGGLWLALGIGPLGRFSGRLLQWNQRRQSP